ncbi:uncharacterized protein LOC129730144 [Wyeomyia smithii]|uniref:uncharacterized protein LOC129730144 n=1 Tax=Wyeomyia smithii TaxID=174621 RepID=UPI002467AF5F|nr:uncharacterized protein LOC129730144 [Wyeomyia smithii]XP_055545203.1 uncharacterized protein LOC129730144 [Wyeomyia smithii]
MSSAWNYLVRKFGRPSKKKTTLETLGHHVVTKKQAAALMTCLEYLTENISSNGLFLSPGNVDHSEQIYRKIESGKGKLLKYLYEISAPRECAMAVNRFIKAYKVSMLPERALNLLCAQNDGIPERLIALDALNLIQHESSGAQLQFARAYLQMMQQLTLRGYFTPHEIKTIISPYLAIPTLFPGRNEMENITAKTVTLMEMFLSVHLLDDPDALSAELEQEAL